MSVSLQVLPDNNRGVSTGVTQQFATIHDFTHKLLQPDILPALKEYVLWQNEVRRASNPEELFDRIPLAGPFSINLDLTTACNYACGHCVDMHILNTGIKFNYDSLKHSIDNLCANGLRSVIVIGGGEPTIDPKFEEIVHFIKDRNLQLAVVTNGSMMKRVTKVGHRFGEKDWVRLSLDSGRDETFQAMHKPKRPIRLEEIFTNVLELKTIHPNVNVGYSFIVTWPGAYTNNQQIVSNIDEIPLAARLAKNHKFDYLSIKPFLDRDERSGAEMIGLSDTASSYSNIIDRIRREVAKARSLEDESFKIIESTNLKALREGRYKDFTIQPKQCHMTYFRQVLSPLGTQICPVYRSNDEASIGGKDAYASDEATKATKLATARKIYNFNAAETCKNVTCLYNDANWFIESLIEDPTILESLQPSPNLDYFL